MWQAFIFGMHWKHGRINPDDIQVVNTFIAAISQHAVPALSRLMAEKHTFADSRGRTVSACSSSHRTN
jgi:hypothetical protein